MRVRMPSMPKIQVPAIFARKPEPKPVALTTVQKLGQFFKNCCCLPCSLCGRAQVKAPVVKLTLSQKISQKALSTLSAGKNFVVAHKKAVGAAVGAATAGVAGYVYFDAVKGLLNNESKKLVDQGFETASTLANTVRDLIVDHPYISGSLGLALAAQASKKVRKIEGQVLAMASNHKKATLAVVGVASAVLANQLGYLPNLV